MITEDQSAVIEFLASPATHGGERVERIETHTACVFLAGSRAYKLKRAVRYDYLDFSTADLRHKYCDAELRLNRRSAPTLYRNVVPITRQPGGSLALGGEGIAVDWIIEMNRFPQEALFDRLASAGQLAIDLMPDLAERIAEFHEHAERRHDHGGRAGMSWVVEGNAAGFAEFGGGYLEPAACDKVTDASRQYLDRAGRLLDARRDHGRVRQCHGDLHLRNIVLIDGQPTLFDAVEFNDEISCTDVLYDVAFLLMDLWRRQLPRHANAVWNRYLAETDDLEGVPLVPLFLSCRASVRAKTSATSARAQGDARLRGELQQTAREYLAMAGQFLQPSKPSLIVVGGVSGSGKSTLAAGLAPRLGQPPGAVILRSDEIRKRLSGVSRLTRLGPEGYTAEVSTRVYATMIEQARSTIRAGYSVVADAVYAHAHERKAIANLAADLAVPFVGLWLDAPDTTLRARVERRRRDPSDADADVVRLQRASGSPPDDWHRLLTSGPAEGVLDRAVALVREAVPTVMNPASTTRPDASGPDIPSTSSSR